MDFHLLLQVNHAQNVGVRVRHRENEHETQVSAPTIIKVGRVHPPSPPVPQPLPPAPRPHTLPNVPSNANPTLIAIPVFTLASPHPSLKFLFWGDLEGPWGRWGVLEPHGVS